LTVAKKNPKCVQQLFLLKSVAKKSGDFFATLKLSSRTASAKTV
jgi:hypothetical protein